MEEDFNIKNCLYDFKTGIYFPKEYETYKNFKKECFGSDYAKTLFEKRIEFILQRQTLTNDYEILCVADDLIMNELQIRECSIDVSTFSFKYDNRYDEHTLDIKEFIENLEGGLDVKCVGE